MRTERGWNSKKEIIIQLKIKSGAVMWIPWLNKREVVKVTQIYNSTLSRLNRNSFLCSIENRQLRMTLKCY